MRINIYAEELTEEVVPVEKVASTGALFYGTRMYLASPNVLHHNAADDDRSAVTLWVPWTQADGHDFNVVRRVLFEALNAVNDIENRHNEREFLKTQGAVQD